MKVKFIYPRFDKFLDTYPDLAEMPEIRGIWSFRMPPAMGIPIAVSLLPPGVDWVLQDENIEEITIDDDDDLVAISFFTPQASYAYALGDRFMAAGKTVVMGGMHPTMVPDDAQAHCHALCVGEAENAWPQMVEDFRRGELKPRYQSSPTRVEQIRVPDPTVLDFSERYDWKASMVSVLRGCPYGCEWCNIPFSQGRELRFRPIPEVVEEIARLEGRDFYMIDDMLMVTRPEVEAYMIALCRELRPLKPRMFLACSPGMNSNPEFLDAVLNAGTASIYMVFASDGKSFRWARRDPRVWDRTVELVKRIDDAGVRFFGSFGVGFDHQGEEQFDTIMDFCAEAQVKTAEFFIATPFPGTAFFRRLEREGRLHQPIDWGRYNCANVVFKPARTTEERVVEGFTWMWREFFSRVDPAVATEPFNQGLRADG
ncbi:MAG TPA: B12-binding domain-containing radical SAM protein [Myxococcota bacterium]|nr:B12-binding domain-containing radical SAM protein [Myxococcota bacterium]